AGRPAAGMAISPPLRRNPWPPRPTKGPACRCPRITAGAPDEAGRGRLAAAAMLTPMSQASAEDALKVTVAHRGSWETAAPHLGQQAGIFKKHGIVLDLTYADDDPEVPVMSGNADVAVGVGIKDALSAYTGQYPSPRVI